MKKARLKVKTQAEITPAVRRQIQNLSKKKDVAEGLRFILSDYQKYRKARQKIEAIVEGKGS